MKIQLCFFLLTLLIGDRVDGKNIKSDNLIKAFIGAYNKTKFYEDRYYKTGSDLDLESVVKHNNTACELLSRSGANSLTNSELNVIARSTGLKILHSQDDSVKIVSWSIFTSSPEPEYFNFLVGKYSPKHASRNLALDVQLDNVMRIGAKDNFHYLLIGSSKCGSGCIVKSAFLYTLVNNSFFPCHNSFFGDGQYLDVISLSYILSPVTEKSADFKITNNSIVVPEVSNDRVTIIGFKEFKVCPCRAVGEAK